MPEVPDLLAYIRREKPYQKARDAWFAEHPLKWADFEVRYLPEAADTMTPTQPDPDFSEYVDPEGEPEHQLPPEKVEALTAAEVQPFIEKRIG